MKKFHSGFALVPIVALVALMILGGAYFFTKENPLPEGGVRGDIVGVPLDSAPVDQGTSDAVQSGIQPYAIEVSWNKELLKLPPAACEGLACYDHAPRYEAGVVTNGVLAGLRFYIHELSEMGGSYFTYHATYGGKDIDLKEKGFVIRGVTDIPAEIAFPGSEYTMKKWYSPSMLFKDLKSPKRLFTIDGLGDFYLTDFGCIMLELPDHTVVAYDFNLPFVIVEEKGLVDLTFEDGTKNAEQYEYTRIGGCGAVCMYLADVKEAELKPGERLVVTATASNGESFYEYKNVGDRALLELYNDKNTLPYVQSSTGSYERQATNRYTYDQFTAFHPLLYWKDPLGRWIQFKNKRFLVAAEKCKPVIYLYPTETTDLNVQVTPNGGFTKTIPQYPLGGWKVRATTDSVITDLSTGNNYSYLYWSGIGLNYPINETEGWVVKKADIAGFLDEKLATLGLNAREIADFKEYWVAKLSDMPYYQLSFLPQNQLDQMAPLAISPAHPNTIIRVMLTAKGLTETKEIKPQVLPETPVRRGFTVAEWGGVVLQ